MTVFIVTGERDAGKTTYCERALLGQPGKPRAGVLLRKAFRGGRCIGYDAVRIGASEMLPFTRRIGDEPSGWDAVQRVGPYSVSDRGRRAADDWVRAACSLPEVGLIIDEVGPLETGGGGLAEAVRYALGRLGPDRELFLVVRRSWLQPVVSCFRIPQHRLIEVASPLRRSDGRC